MRIITLIVLLITFIGVSVSGVMLTATHGAFEKSFPVKDLHEFTGFLFIGAGLVHLGFNVRPLMAYINFRNKPPLS